MREWCVYVAIAVIKKSQELLLSKGFWHFLFGDVKENQLMLTNDSNSSDFDELDLSILAFVTSNNLETIQKKGFKMIYEVSPRIHQSEKSE